MLKMIMPTFLNNVIKPKGKNEEPAKAPCTQVTFTFRKN